MPRVTVSDVTNTFETGLEANAVQDWIEVANEIVNDIASKDDSISDNRLELLERLVAQHMCAAQDQRVEEDEVGDSAHVYQGQYGRHFESTSYGQRAITLDPTGHLKSAGKENATIRTIDSRNLYD